jgi:hypothetical protein
MTWEERVTQLESEGLTRSDAQGAVDVEVLEGWRPSDFQPWMLLRNLNLDQIEEQVLFAFAGGDHARTRSV